MTEIEVVLEPRAGDSDVAALASAVQQRLQTAFNLRIPVSCVSPGGLPRFEMKAKRWLRSER